MFEKYIRKRILKFFIELSKIFFGIRIYFISFIVVLGIPVFLHELGHFLAAKSVGIKVEKFYVGFDFFNLGIKKKYKDTEYGVGLFPLGGYVKVAGILDENIEIIKPGDKIKYLSFNEIVN